MQQQLHHRTNNTKQQLKTNDNQSQTTPNEKEKDTRKTHKLATPSQLAFNLRTWTFKRVFRFIISTITLLSLSIYVIVLVLKDWPPNGTTLNPDGSINLFQGDWWVSPNLTRADRIMLVIAHPDDECLFFSPTLLNLLSPRYVNRTEFNASPLKLNDHNTSIHKNLSPKAEQLRLESPMGHILSLSSGNAEGLGIKRAREMRASCWAFGISSEHCMVVDHPDLPDSMSVWWPEKTIIEFVEFYIKLWNIDAIITFDHHGVSGHINHRAIASALSRLVHSDPHFPMTFMLRSRSLIEKYTSIILSVPLSLYRHNRNHQQESLNMTSTPPMKRITDSRLSTHSSIFISTPTEYYEGRRAFNQHISQQIWFRRFWLVCSRYMWINELFRIIPIHHRFSDFEEFRKPSMAENIIFPSKIQKKK
ncbi:hypothetical protein Pst134EA_029248 [Puccinia striiformis f. sp. tritici]|uniref:N-acetylglucosaminylphosphatidylinositol deacetylase n=1 Tax=Puccinia striiformis f. sp. tritici PST-78 TaxID=1165861 RepID=A0A0L0UZA3_9BASI|nr:hypothetical protein Pst134EA_029248 [Puccinia striiformis f. sp. tritici]KAH9441242.1 hypothetical protein Pst134EB_029909 [Puccinia striiformis f. sp. tritici]KAH9447213.1 hypothetical protein Pst134EA_029248 [Puccinia striiformis f. sp. tritici]KNE92355.1 hypothetical protein, variant [Puccinia striiformis f. sp. tritici PST-78]